MLQALLLLILVILLLVFLEDYLGRYKWPVYILLCLYMIVYSGLRPVGFDRDSTNYEMMFLYPDSNQSDISVESSYIIISKILYVILSDVHILFILFAIFGISLKYIAVKRLTPLFFLPILVYSCNFFLLHDITQIRAGIASGMFLMALSPLASGKKLRAFGYMLAGIVFHYSSLALLPLLLLNNKPISKIWKIIMALFVPICLLLYILDIDILLNIPIPYISDKLEGYKIVSELGKIEKESILNPLPLMKMAIFLYFLYFSETIKHYVPSIYLLIKVLACSIVSYFALSSITIVSMRVSELYGIVEIVAYPCIIYTTRPQIIGKCIVCMVAFIEIFFTLAMWEILDFNI